MEKMFYGPWWPLGHIAVDYRGEGQGLLSNLTEDTETSEYAEDAALGLIISPCRSGGSVKVANTGAIYLCWKSPVDTFDSLGYPDTVILCILQTQPGPIQVPSAQYGSNRYKLSELGIDADVNGDGAFVTAIMQ